ncbi:MAG: hypothetical protein KGK08_04015 [Acidobacteriota bacterium]|nr:hypothetical protein [Acidobacteriota bacterium]
MRPLCWCRLALCLLPALGAPAHGQQPSAKQSSAKQSSARQATAKPPTTRPPDTIHSLDFRGAPAYAASALQQLSGLHPGEQITQKGLAAAADRLVNSGYFANVEAEFTGTAPALEVVFTLKPEDPAGFLRVSLENFVWWQPEELRRALTSRLPLYQGALPEAGPPQQALQDALQQLLQQRGIHATVVSELIAPYPGQPWRIAAFRMESPTMTLHSVTLHGDSAAFAAQLQQVTSDLLDKPYNEGITSASLQSRILQVYRAAGYQAATITRLERHVTATPPYQVDADVTLDEGTLYRVAAVHWAGSAVLSTQAFVTAAALHPGDIATQAAVSQATTVLDTAYRGQGYMDVSIDPVPTLDSARHTVTFDFAVQPGVQYHLHTFQCHGLSPEQQQELNATFPVRPGQIYDANAIDAYLKNDGARKSLTGMAATFQLAEDPEAGTLDLDMDFHKAPPPPAATTHAAPSPTPAH